MVDFRLLDGEALRPVCTAGRVCLAAGVWAEAGAVGFRIWVERDLDTASRWCSFCTGFSTAALSPSAGEERNCRNISIRLKAEDLFMQDKTSYKHTNRGWIRLCLQVRVHLPVA